MKGWLDKYQEGGNVAYADNTRVGNVPRYIAPKKGEDMPVSRMIEMTLGAPQRLAVQAITGKEQYPSEALGIKNPWGALAADAVLDPTNLIGAGLAKKAISSVAKKKTTKKVASEIDLSKLNNISFENNLKRGENAFNIISNGERIGDLDLAKNYWDKGSENQWVMDNIGIDQSYRGKGLGKEAYIKANDLLKSTGRGNLYSSGTFEGGDAKRVWESLVRSGHAEQLGDDAWKFMDNSSIAKKESAKKILSKADFAKWDKEILNDELKSTTNANINAKGFSDVNDKYWNIPHNQSGYKLSDYNIIDSYTLDSSPFHSNPDNIKQLDEIITKQKGESFPLVRHFEDEPTFKTGLRENDLLQQYGELSPNRPLSFSSHEGFSEFGKNRMLLTKPEEQSYLKTQPLKARFTEREIVLPSKVNYKVHNVVDNTFGGKDYHVNITNPYMLGLPVAAATAATMANQEKRNGGWLEKYNDGGPIQPNYNDYSVSASPDFVGEGYSNVGRNYSPAWGGQFAMGGSIGGATQGIPGATGFMYARVAGSTPSKGKGRNKVYKTDASAQNGAEMKFYQEGLDFKPKSISKNGSELTKLDQLTNFTNYNTKQPGGWLDKYQ